MQSRFLKLFLPFLLLGIFVLTGCGSENNGIQGKIAPFNSDGDFDAFVSNLSPNSNSDGPYEEDLSESSSEDMESGITTTQEAGVDEGAIVKVYENYLIILRRGKLFTVSLSSPMQAVDQSPVYPEGINSNAWYDEMLIYGDQIVVVGYSYTLGGTELELFEIDDAGQLHYQSSYLIESNDYYSSRNYTSRLIGSQLVFYMPTYLWESNGSAKIPSLKTWDGTDWQDLGPVVEKTDIYRPLDTENIDTLHLVLRCDLDKSKFSCSGDGILGHYSRNFYVSKNNVYLWVSSTKSTLYQMNLSDGGVKGVQVSGSPFDSFSFKEKENALYVLISSAGSGDAMWEAEFNEAEGLALVKVPLESFSEEVTPLDPGAYTYLGEVLGAPFFNRFIGDYVLYGSPGLIKGTIFLKDLDHPEGPVISFTLEHGLERIEVIGENAVLVGSQGEDLGFTTLDLSASPILKSHLTLEGAYQVETRSQAFVYGTLSELHVIGIPIVNESTSSMVFLQLDDDLQLSELGTLKSSEVQVEDACVVSCTDWYGNSRPILWNGRLIALMGYELVEATVSDGKIAEIDRLNFLEELISPER